MSRNRRGIKKRSMQPKYKLSQKYKNFVFTKVVPLQEINCILYELTHTPTGASILHIAADDPENVFCLSFRTYPNSDNGVAHILEHAVLCGSKRFPVKDPFFSMNRRSLNTFMNALTGADTTCYPAASQVEADFYNLLDIYLDAVFYPELKQLSFLQEGHRLEFEDPEDPLSRLQYKGIVFNEMKGSLNNPESRLWHAINRALFPDNLYRYNSGGDPKVIPTLTYEELKQFHETYYHPSQCLFYFYGNFHLEKHLDFIEDKVLKDTQKKEKLPLINQQPRAKKRQKRTAFYPATHEDEEKSFISFSWLTTPITDVVETLALCLLDAILMENDASPLKLAVQQSNLTIQADSLLETDMSEVPYVIVCRGCKATSADELEKILFKELKQIAKKGIPQKSIDAVFHQFELSRLEIASDFGPYGLTLFMRSGLLKQHGLQPEDALMVHSLLKQLQTLLSDPNYLPQLIKKHFIDNHHYVRLTMSPDTQLAQQEIDEEKKQLEAIEKKLTKADKEHIVGTALSLMQFQEKQEDLDCLPKLSLRDIPKDVVHFPLQYRGIDQLALYTHETFTNGVNYADIVFDLYETPQSDLHILKLFISIITEIGSGIRNYKETLEFIQSFTGGIHCSIALNPLYTAPNLLRPTLSLHGKCLEKYTDHLFGILKDTMLLPSLDDHVRIKELILQTYTYLHDHINRSALGYAIKSALAPFSEHNHVINQISGLPYYQFIKDLAENIDEQLPKVIAQLGAVKEKLFHLNNPHLIMTTNASTIDHLHKKEFYKIPRIASSPFQPWVGNYSPQQKSHEGKIIASSVAFTVKAYSVFHYQHPLSGPLFVATLIMENKILHQKIREQGGAYGSGATYYPLTGSCYFYAYRDPNLSSTLEAFDLAIRTIGAGKFSDRDLFEAKLGVIQGFDQPISIGARGSATYFFERKGLTQKVRQNYRNSILEATHQDVARATKEAFETCEGQISVFSSKEFFSREKSTCSLDISEI